MILLVAVSRGCSSHNSFALERGDRQHIVSVDRDARAELFYDFDFAVVDRNFKLRLPYHR